MATAQSSCHLSFVYGCIYHTSSSSTCRACSRKKKPSSSSCIANLQCPQITKEEEEKLLRCRQWNANLRLSPTAEAFGNPNLKWVSNTIPPTEYAYRRSILGIRRGIIQIWVSSLLETHLQRMLSFRSCCWRRLKIGMETFTCSATQRTNGSCILYFG